MLMINVRHNWPEHPPYTMMRTRGNTEYMFLHFYDELDISVGGKTHACPSRRRDHPLSANHICLSRQKMSIV